MDIALKLLENSEVDYDTGCWNWTKCKRNGYGQVWFEGKAQSAHRVTFKLFKNYLPEVVRHTCDNPSCINPNHLEGGTQADNVRDTLERGRTAKGADNGLAKLTEDAVREIRYILSSGHLTQQQIGNQFDVSQNVISHIKTGKIWAHVS